MAPQLDALRAVPGLAVAVLVGADGLALSQVGEGADLLAAELTALRTSMLRTARRLGVGEITRLSFTTGNLEVVALTHGDYVLGAAVMRGNDTRQAQQALAQVMSDLAASAALPAEPGGEAQ
ncbi:roadblock/LC7 domain-containing protein [Deinococcus lacus]|uniref:Roadblock/LC7 domain-containing protein n=1 Tax=Deinococcus lacus TaxID=392561 RepID=A0ABW1YCJ3_9DEIO